VPADECPEGFEAEPGDVGAVVDGGVSERFEQVTLAGAGRAAYDQVLFSFDPLECGQ